MEAAQSHIFFYFVLYVQYVTLNTMDISYYYKHSTVFILRNIFNSCIHDVLGPSNSARNVLQEAN